VTSRTSAYPAVYLAIRHLFRAIRHLFRAIRHLFRAIRHLFGTSGEAAAPEALHRIIVTDIPLHPGRSGPYGRRMTICMVLVHRVWQQRPVRGTIAAAAVAPEVMGLAPTL
jgi:hypothetical protein